MAGVDGEVERDNTSSYPLTIEGIRLDNLAFNIESKTGRFGTPPVRGENIIIPGRHGRKWNPYKRYDEARYYLSMWVRGCTKRGNVPSGASEFALFSDNLDSLKTLFGRRHELLDVRQAWVDGTERQAMCEVTATIEPDFIGVKSTAAKFSVELINPDAFWRDISAREMTLRFGSEAIKNEQMQLDTMAGMTAPVDDAVFVIVGPANNPRIRDPHTGHYVQLNQNLSSQMHWRFECGTFESRVGQNIGFDGAGENAVPDTVRVGPMMPSYIVIGPRNNNPPLLHFATTGGGTSNTRVMIRARRKYL